jgi:hypothetical protein
MVRLRWDFKAVRRDVVLHYASPPLYLVGLKPQSPRSGENDFSLRRFDHHCNLAPPYDVAHALERDQERHHDQTGRDEAYKEDQIPNCRSSAQLPPDRFLSPTTIRVYLYPTRDWIQARPPLCTSIL